LWLNKDSMNPIALPVQITVTDDALSDVRAMHGEAARPAFVEDCLKELARQLLLDTTVEETVQAFFPGSVKGQHY